MEKLIYSDETYAIRGACFEVYKTLGSGFLESVYQECLGIELKLRGIPFQSQPKLSLEYKGMPLASAFIPDFICYDSIILELKAIRLLGDPDRAQLHNYLKSGDIPVGLLINFGHRPRVEIERVARTEYR